MRVEDRAVRAVAVVGAAAAAAAGLWAGWRVGLGVGLGAGLSVVNLHWLRAGANAIIYDAVATSADSGVLERLGPRARWGGLRFVGRFGLLAGSLCAIFMSHIVPFPAVLGGLLAAPAGVMAAVAMELWKPSSGSRTC